MLAGRSTPTGRSTRSTASRDDDLVQLLYTSGTTVAAKGAMLTHRALVHEYVVLRRRARAVEPTTSRCTRCRSTTRRRCTRS